MAKAQVNIESVENFRQAVSKQRETIGELNGNLKSSASDMADKIAAELEKANQLSAKCEQAKTTLSAKQGEANVEIENLYSQLAATPETITETSTDEDGNMTSEEVPNPEYARLQGEIASVQTRIDLLNGLQGRLDALGNNLQSQKDLLSVSGAEVLEIIDALSTKSTNFSNLSETAVEKLDKIRDTLQNYLDTKITPPGVSHGGYIKINSPMRFSTSGQGGSIQGKIVVSQGTTIDNSKARNLEHTEQTWQTWTGGDRVYNTPLETGQKLDSNQGKVEGYTQDCGIVASLNVARLAGIEIDEKKAVELAKSHGLCDNPIGGKDGGGTSPEQRQELLRQMGVESRLETASVDLIAQRISEGRGVIVSVRADRLWQNGQSGLHAITVTSVVKDARGSVNGFFVCDSGTHGIDGARYYTAAEIENALTPKRSMNVTQNIIR